MEAPAVSSLTNPERRYSGVTVVIISMKWVAPQPIMNAPNIQNTQGNGTSARLRANQTKVIGMETYATQIRLSETLWSQTSPGFQPPQVPRAVKPVGSKSLEKKSSIVTSPIPRLACK